MSSAQISFKKCIQLAVIAIAISLTCSVSLVQAQSDTDTVMCTQDAKQCPDGSWVSRHPPTCQFAACPEPEDDDGEIIVCTADVFICPDGSSVSRVLPTCEFEACPAYTTEGIKVYGQFTNIDHTNELINETQVANPEVKYIGRHFFQVLSVFPSQVTKLGAEETGDEKVQITSRMTGQTVTLTPVLSRMSEGNLGSLEQIPAHIVSISNDNRVVIVPVINAQTPYDSFFDKGYIYSFSWEYVFEDSSLNNSAFSTRFASISTSTWQSDLDNNQLINLLDYSILSREFLRVKPKYDADLNGDQRVDLRDYSIFIREYQYLNP